MLASTSQGDGCSHERTTWDPDTDEFARRQFGTPGSVLIWGIISMSRAVLVAIFVTGAMGVPQASADVIDEAYRLCTAADATGLLSAPCSVSGSNSAVDLSIDTSGPEAAKICRGMANLVAQQGVRFGAGWKIRIYSPFSSSNTIAVCKLP